MQVVTHDKSSELELVGDRLRLERKRLGFSVLEMGKIGGVNRNSQGEYETGKRPFTSSYMLALASAGIDIGYIMTGDRSMPKDERPAELSLVTMRVAMPPQPALARMFEGVLQVYPDLQGGELAQALARHLPNALAQLTDLQPTSALQIGSGSATSDNPPANHREPRPAQRT